MHYQTVMSQVILEGLWGAQEVAWWQHDFKEGDQDQPSDWWLIWSGQKYRSVTDNGSSTHEALLCTFQ